MAYVTQHILGMLACSDEAHTLDSHGPGVESCLPHIIFLTFSFPVYKKSLKSDGLPIPRCYYKDSNKIMHVKFLIYVTKSNSKHLHSIYHALRTISKTLYVLTLHIPIMILWYRPYYYLHFTWGNQGPKRSTNLSRVILIVSDYYLIIIIKYYYLILSFKIQAVCLDSGISTTIPCCLSIVIACWIFVITTVIKYLLKYLFKKSIFA